MYFKLGERMKNDKINKKIYDDKCFIGRILRNARKKSGMTQIQLSELVELSDKNIGNIENGSQFPQVNNFLRMLEVLPVSIEDFGIKKGEELGETQRELLKKIYSSTPTEAEKYLEALNFVDKISEIK